MRFNQCFPRGKELLLSGVVPFSSIDFPGTLAAVLFCQGCPWNCRYCHNSHLRPFRSSEENREWSWEKVREFLHARRGFLTAVVFSGGEPTAQSGLRKAIEETRSMGFLIGLHTSGAYPRKLKKILPLVDWIGLDIKAPLDERYDWITRTKGSSALVRSSLDKILAAGTPCQLRTTVHPLLHPTGDLEDLQLQLQNLGAQPSILQKFRTQGCKDVELIATAA